DENRGVNKAKTSSGVISGMVCYPHTLTYFVFYHLFLLFLLFFVFLQVSLHKSDHLLLPSTNK
ncbi:MAG: hypothetical protein ACKPH7_00920, partial [Planktothrix sp.]|uniref:hypothetical protein n=1 Tax=Planktothrix sp. TaxID=3088171 RepID=UPI0038D51569